jgi:hypothetical protein
VGVAAKPDVDVDATAKLFENPIAPKLPEADADVIATLTFATTV